MIYEIIIDCNNGLYLAQSNIKNYKKVKELFKEWNFEHNDFYVRKHFPTFITLWRMIKKKSQSYNELDYSGNQKILSKKFDECIYE